MTELQRKYLKTGAIFILLGVAMGAFGAHALKEALGSGGIETWKTAVFYQMVHGLSLLAVSSVADRLPRRKSILVFILFVLGIFLFSGSLYTLALTQNSTLRSIMGPLTPLGGISFIVAWIVFLWAIFKTKK